MEPYLCATIETDDEAIQGESLTSCGEVGGCGGGVAVDHLVAAEGGTGGVFGVPHPVDCTASHRRNWRKSNDYVG